MIPEEFKYNPNVSYSPGGKYTKKNIELVKQAIYVNKDDYFPVTFPDLFQKYQNPTLHTNEPWNTWLHSSFDWWQCQLNFAVWCATAGCGVSYQDHLQITSGLTKTVYTFHVYYCISRILKELKTPLPTDASFCYYKNPYDKAVYQKLCNEFNVSPNTDWRQKLDHGCEGLGAWSTYMEPSHEYRHAHAAQGPFFHPKDSIMHNRNISRAWTMFILDKSEGFTKAGIERINESIRMFVWALLGAQSQTRVEILKIGTGFDAQKQFLANVQDAINSPIDLPTQISKYQDVLKYARSEVDYTYGLGLYMSPNDMILQIGTIVGYNNKIVIATDDQTLGFNSDVNIKPVLPISQPATIQGTPTKKSLPEPDITKESLPNQIIKSVETKDKQPTKEATQHEDNKTALIVGSIVIGIIALAIYEIF